MKLLEEEEEKEEEESERKGNHHFVHFLAVGLRMHFSYLCDIIG